MCGKKCISALPMRFSFVSFMGSLGYTDFISDLLLGHFFFAIEIAKEAGSSPETLRKAFRELQQQGVIEKTRKGYFVTSDKIAVAAFRERYLASIEEAYHNAIAKVEICKL